jgi:hypothetical protein
VPGAFALLVNQRIARFFGRLSRADMAKRLDWQGSSARVQMQFMRATVGCGTGVLAPRFAIPAAFFSGLLGVGLGVLSRWKRAEGEAELGRPTFLGR